MLRNGRSFTGRLTSYGVYIERVKFLALPPISVPAHRTREKAT